MTARMLMALVFSGVVFLAIFAVNFLAKSIGISESANNAVLQVLGLLMGLSWEAAFGEAVEGIGHRFEIDVTRLEVQICITVLLCLMVLPAWAWYILPQAI